MSKVYLELQRAGLIAGAAFLVQAPYLVYLARVAYPEAVSRRFPALSTEDLLAAELLRIALTVVLAALIGAFLSVRNGLPGLGDRAAVRAALPWIVGAGVVSLAGYAVTGRQLSAALPGQYPDQLHWALVALAKGAVFDEVIARYGMMTIAMGVVRKAWAANLLQAIFFAGVGARALFFEGGGAGPGLDALTLASVATSLAVSLAAGHVYARHGLYAAMALHAAFGLRFVAHALTSST